jgi:hypothetical protein
MGYQLNLQIVDVVLKEFEEEFKNTYPIVISILGQYREKILSETETMKTAKNFYLSTLKSKKQGYVYYVKYRGNDGAIIPSHWSTGTNIHSQALDFATNNRERILQDYYAKNEADNLYKTLAEYYNENGNEAYDLDVTRGDRKSLCERNELPQGKPCGIRFFYEKSVD